MERIQREWEAQNHGIVPFCVQVCFGFGQKLFTRQPNGIADLTLGRSGVYALDGDMFHIYFVEIASNPECELNLLP